MDQIPLLNPVLLFSIAAVAGILIQVGVKPLFKPDSRWLPLASVVISCGVAAGWTYLGAEIPEGVKPVAYLLLHGIFAGGLSCGAWSGGKALLGK